MEGLHQREQLRKINKYNKHQNFIIMLCIIYAEIKYNEIISYMRSSEGSVLSLRKENS